MLRVFHEGTEYTLFDSVRVTTSLDSICGQFVIKTTLRENPPFGIGDYLVIKNEYNLVVCSGYIEKMEGSITKSSAQVTFSGRDILGDLVDSTVPANVSLINGPLTLDVMCQKVMTALGLPGMVINTAGSIKPFNADEITAGSFTQKAGNLLQSFSRKRQLFLTTDGKGNLVIFTSPSRVEYNRKLTRDSMLGRSFSFDTSKRYNKIIVGSEDNFASSDSASSVDRRSEYEDVEIRSSRQLQINAEQSMNDGELEGKAKEEVSIRRADGFAFTCTVPSHNYVKGKLIPVDDELSGVEGIFLIKKVLYISEQDKNVSDLTLCYPETYEALGVRTTRRKSKIVQADKFNPENVPGIVEGFDSWTMLDDVEGAEL